MTRRPRRPTAQAPPASPSNHPHHGTRTLTMQISARSYLTAGVSLTAAAAVALTPVAVPTPDRAVTIPKVTVTDINLTVTPAEIVAFFESLETQIKAFNASVAEVAAVPGQTV